MIVNKQINKVKGELAIAAVERAQRCEVSVLTRLGRA
jgi:hypothetical protein